MGLHQSVFLRFAGKYLLGLCLLALTVGSARSDGSNASSDFPRFYFKAHDREAQLLSRYLWYHYTNRLYNCKTMFNKEYLTLADSWLGGATYKDADTKGRISIQDQHRSELTSTRIDAEGYVDTHQHISHAQDHGWPFPLWCQSQIKNKTAGWLFQEGPVKVIGNDKWMLEPQYMGEAATRVWELTDLATLGIVDGRWRLKSTGPSPAITTPKDNEVDAFNAPFLQLRWKRIGESRNRALPYLEWLREGDADFGEDRRVYIYPDENNAITKDTGVMHSIMPMYRHPKWQGQIKRIRISLAPGESDATFDIDSFFTAYDTRHPTNNPIFILACWNQFRWTGDKSFLRANINRMRTALRFLQTDLGGLKYNRIRVSWVGHDGLPGFKTNPDGSKTYLPGHGIGNNYWDLLPFGWDDMYCTTLYYTATLAMADVEEAVKANPSWDVPSGPTALDPSLLRKHAARVKTEANKLFWNRTDGRFVGSIDADGNSHDYGFIFVNLEAITYGIASDEHAAAIMDWIIGKRIVKGDTSTGADIYHWRFAPRATTKRNIDWYGQGWYLPEQIPWGGQVQDGGAVLGFSYHDLTARLNTIGPDDAWRRLCEILEWEQDAKAAGGYRQYYKDGKRGSLQGGGTAGGLGIDQEFFESSMVPSAVTCGFLGLQPNADELFIKPRLPRMCPEMGVSNVLYHNIRLDVKASENNISIELKDRPIEAIRVKMDGEWRLDGVAKPASLFNLREPSMYLFSRVESK